MEVISTVKEVGTAFGFNKIVNVKTLDDSKNVLDNIELLVDIKGNIIRN